MDYRLDILNVIYPKYWLQEDLVKWNTVYKAWKQWRMMDKLHCRTSTIDETIYNITCILISGIIFILFFITHPLTCNEA